MSDLNKNSGKIWRLPKILSFEVLVGIIAVAAMVVMMWTIVAIPDSVIVIMIAGIVFTICVCLILYMLMKPDSVRAKQTDSMLKLSSKMVDLMSNGMDFESAQGVCELLLPSTDALAVAITDTTTILGYAGYMEAENPQGIAIRTQATRDTVEDGEPRVLLTADEIGLPKGSSMIKSAIIVPLKTGRKKSDIRGTLKFYFKSHNQITETQKSIAQGFGELLSTQIAASELEEQRELATAMELKMLQNQINPHFLFNTINTIASLIRTDPPKARVLLREFAVFYRSTLENSQEKIPLARELEQTARYFSFEVARFGEDRLELNIDLPDNASEAADQEPIEADDLAAAVDAVIAEAEEQSFSVSEMEVPPFLVQPLVENAVKHAMPVEGKLTINIYAETVGPDVFLHVDDDGVGMTEEDRLNIMHPESQTGLGIAVKNIHDRMHGFYGEEAAMLVDSEIGNGTRVTLRFPNIVKQPGN